MYDPMGEHRLESRGTISLVLGILGIMLLQPLGIGAVILGNQVMREVPAQHEQYGLANVGRILGWIAIALFFVSLAIAMVVVGFIVVAAASSM